MEVTTPEQCKSAFSIVDYYHPDVVKALRVMIDETTDETELSIARGLLRGLLEHLLNEAQKRIEVKAVDK